MKLENMPIFCPNFCEWNLSEYLVWLLQSPIYPHANFLVYGIFFVSKKSSFCFVIYNLLFHDSLVMFLFLIVKSHSSHDLCLRWRPIQNRIDMVRSMDFLWFSYEFPWYLGYPIAITTGQRGPPPSPTQRDQRHRFCRCHRRWRRSHWGCSGRSRRVLVSCPMRWCCQCCRLLSGKLT